MKHLLRFVVVVLLFPVIATSESVEEEELVVCDDSIYYDEHLHISIAEIHERLVSLSWPDILPPLSQARINAYALFQIKVSASGEVCFIESKSGSPLIVHPLTPAIKKWKFRPNKPFWGVIVIRYVSSGNGFYFL